ncbi:MAG: hypothetical protein DRJ66_03685 [Thermoprotei archaeon]|nr:MAG: hypothetical protein DRJ66_03685 [Thermoprotei archaeon]
MIDHTLKNNECGIDLQDSFNNNIQGNVVYNNTSFLGDIGVFLSNALISSIITKNIIRNNDARIHPSSSSDNTITDNFNTKQRVRHNSFRVFE